MVGEAYEVIGDYHSASKKITLRHKECDHFYDVRPSNFLSGGRCPRCAEKALKTTEQFKAEVKWQVGEEYEVIGDYQRSTQKITLLHRSCGHVYDVLPKKILNGNRCPCCTPKRAKRKNITTEG